MQITISQVDKQEAQLAIDNVTIAEILRVYLYQEGVEFAAWRREHPSRPVVMVVKHSGGVQKVIKQAINALTKDCDALVKALK